MSFQPHHSYRSCENRPAWGARQFQALRHLAEGLFCFKRRIYKKYPVLIIIKSLINKYFS